MPMRRPRICPFFRTSNCLQSCASAQKTPIQIVADLTDAPRKLYHAEMELPVGRGRCDFITPQWIPGNHRPTGPGGRDYRSGVHSRRQDLAVAPRRCEHVRVSPDHSARRDQAACASGLHCDRAREPEDGGAGVGEAAALSGSHAGARHSDSAVGQGTCGMGIGTALTPVGGGSWPVPAAGSTHTNLRPPTWSNLRTRP